MGTIQTSTGKGNNTVNTTTVWDRIVNLENNVGVSGTPIKEKVDALETSLAQKANQSDLTPKADKTYVDNELTKKANSNELTIKADKSYVDTQISNIGNASPKGTYATLTDLQTAFPTGTTGIYVVTADGKWYYWSGSAWTAGGTYQSTGISDGSITWAKLGNLDAFIYPFPLSSFVLEQSGGDAYLKADNIYIRNVHSNSVAWATITTQLSSYVATSPAGIANCIKVSSAFTLVYNIKTLVFEIVGSFSVQPYHIILIRSNNSELTGLFKQRYDRNKFESDIATNKTNIATNASDVSKIKTMNGIFANPFPRNSLVIEDNGAADINNQIIWVYFFQISIRNSLVSTILWSSITTQFASRIETSPKGASNCLKMTTDEALVYNINTGALEIIAWNAVQSYHYVLLRTAYGKVFGRLADIYNADRVDQKLSDLETKVPVSGSDSAVPSYWVSTLDSKISQIKTKQNQFGKDGFSLGFVTDMHYPANYLKSPILMAKVLKECDIKYFVNGGDVHNQTTTLAETITTQRKVMDSFKDAGIVNKMLLLQGNHDDNTQGVSGTISADIVMSPDVTYSERFRHTEDVKNITASDDGLYYFVDDKVQKVRIILLNSHDSDFTVDGNNMVLDSGYITYVYKQEQIDWFANVALNTPDDSWTVLIASHVPPTETNIVDTYRQAINTDIMVGIANAYKNKTSYTGSHTDANSSYSASISIDYSTKGGEVVGWICGHTHSDNISAVGDIPVLNTTCDSFDRLGVNSSPRASGTVTEQAFDIITVNKRTKTCYVTRIGAGNDRSFTY